MIIETPTPDVVEAAAKDGYAIAVEGKLAWSDLSEATRDAWRLATKRALERYASSPWQIEDDERKRLEAEGWRWGWELNEQLKTDPRLNIHAPDVGPYRAMLRAAHAAAHRRLDR